jgi:hypothetical protein
MGDIGLMRDTVAVFPFFFPRKNVMATAIAPWALSTRWAIYSIFWGGFSLEKKWENKEGKWIGAAADQLIVAEYYVILGRTKKKTRWRSYCQQYLQRVRAQQTVKCEVTTNWFQMRAQAWIRAGISS